MRTPTAEIRQAFYARLLEKLPQGLAPADIAWPNAAFVPETGKIYIAPWLLFNETRTVTLSREGYEELSGVFQVAICGLPGEGEGEIDRLAADITDIFRAGTVLELCGYQGVLITCCWRSGLRLKASDSAEGRPLVTVSAMWQQHTSKGDRI